MFEKIKKFSFFMMSLAFTGDILAQDVPATANMGMSSYYIENHHIRGTIDQKRVSNIDLNHVIASLDGDIGSFDVNPVVTMPTSPFWIFHQKLIMEFERYTYVGSKWTMQKTSLVAYYPIVHFVLWVFLAAYSSIYCGIKQLKKLPYLVFFASSMLFSCLILLVISGATGRAIAEIAKYSFLLFPTSFTFMCAGYWIYVAVNCRLGVAKKKCISKNELIVAVF